MLLEAGIIDAAQLQAALGHQRRWGGRLGQALVDLKITSEVQIVDTLSRKLGYDPIRLAAVEYGPSLELALRLVPHEFAQRNVLLPYAADMGTIWVAMADPTNVALVDEIAFRTGRKVKVSLAGDREIADAVRRLYLMEKRGVDAIAIDDVDDAPVEMAGSFGGGTSQALDAFFQRTPSPPTSAGSQVEVVPIAVTPGDAAARRNAAPPPAGAAPASAASGPATPAAPGRSGQGIPPAGAAARLAEAVRGLRLEDEPTAARPVPGTAPPAAAPVAARAPADAGAPSPASSEAPPGGSSAAPVWVPAPLPEGADGRRTLELPLSEVTPLDEPQGSPRLHALLDALDRASRADASGPETARLARAVSAIVRVLLAKGLVDEDELLAAFLRK
jgi:type IV pilus assembly protein PilB